MSVVGHSSSFFFVFVFCLCVCVSWFFLLLFNYFKKGSPAFSVKPYLQSCISVVFKNKLLDPTIYFTH